ncbi:hypothetical protein KDK_37720 [Dictyobacter kobayashii]|uniref:BACON domain-containing protein n=2 Tax=Dictyobacter kobayashii TaxID=2014872 RepID=A0A402ALG0_9CHLR|nr:hypothetical protein KDK_37720 [Dictyobacter kobayashii]
MADVHVLVEDNWGAGTHYFGAEELREHYVATTMVQVIGTGQELSAHLNVMQTRFDMGKDIPDTNALQPIQFTNTGGGFVSWTANSDQSWLTLTPMQGTFSNHQRIILAVSRANLLPGAYQGNVTIVSNTGKSVNIHVRMEVQAAPGKGMSSLVVTPAVRSFVAIDGGANPTEQQITISNPGTVPLHWSLNNMIPMTSDDQNMLSSSNMNWLTTNASAGELAPRETTNLRLIVHTNTLLPGVYSSVLSFVGGQDTIKNPQPVAISLTIQPRCGVTPSVGNLAFSGVSGQTNALQQDVSLSLSADCPGPLAWQAFSQTSWLKVFPDHGQVSINQAATLTVSVAATALQPGTYDGYIIFFTERRTQTVYVQLSVLSSESAAINTPISIQGNESTAPTVRNSQVQKTNETSTNTNSGGASSRTSMSNMQFRLSPSQLSFQSFQGNGDPNDQLLNLTNMSDQTLSWQANSDNANLVAISPAQGTVEGGQTIGLVVHSSTDFLPAGNYSAHILITLATTAGSAVAGSPQTIPVVINVVQPCTLQVAPSSLSFDASLLQTAPPAQAITLRATGDCNGQAINWSAQIDAHTSNWLSLSTSAGSVDANGCMIFVSANADGMLLNVYHSQITFTASDTSKNTLQAIPQTVTVTLNVFG